MCQLQLEATVTIHNLPVSFCLQILICKAVCKSNHCWTYKAFFLFSLMFMSCFFLDFRWMQILNLLNANTVKNSSLNLPIAPHTWRTFTLRIQQVQMYQNQNFPVFYVTDLFRINLICNAIINQFTLLMIPKRFHAISVNTKLHKRCV